MRNLWEGEPNAALATAATLLRPLMGAQLLNESRFTGAKERAAQLLVTYIGAQEVWDRTRHASCRTAILTSLSDAMSAAAAEPDGCCLIAILLRLATRLSAPEIAPALCSILMELHRGLWSKRPAWELFELRAALSRALAAIEPASLTPLWEGLLDADPVRRSAMLDGVHLLRAEHAAPHLVYLLETSHDHAIRSLVVDLLEEMADPMPLDSLRRLRQETAKDDWTLSRHIARAVRVIEGQNPGTANSVLLRPTAADNHSLLHLIRPVDRDDMLLLRGPWVEDLDEPEHESDDD
jgi:hypothetical protein